jgi:opacity protein-like surface antigen
MRIARIHPALFFLAVALVLAPGIALAQTSIALSAYGAFTGTTTGNGTQQSPSNQAGGLFQLRHTSNPILGFEATYSFNRANEAYSASAHACPVGIIPCGPLPAYVSANAHEITGDWIPSVHIANLRPFGILGAGVLLNIPAGNQAETSTSTKAVYVYGAGLDWGLLPHIGLRLQYRGNLYQAPNLTKLYSSTDAFTHTAEPMIGIYFRL